jgi:predicted amidohydrolase
MDLTVSTLQTSLYWEDSAKNIAHMTEKIAALPPTDLLILPEMFTTGFTMKPESLAEEAGGKGLQWMQEQALAKGCALVGSISVKEKGNYYNRLYWVKPDGSFLAYDKRHLFSMGKEHEHYTAGSSRLTIDYKGWKICPLICYDLRFPVWSRNTAAEPYDLLLYVANWPELRSFPWKQLLIARAIENQCYVAGVNRIGADGNGFSHSGDTVVLNPRGEALSRTQAHEDRLETLTLSYQALSEFREAFPVLKDADLFKIG